MLQTATSREQRIEQALFRGANLTLNNPDYARAVRAITDELLRADFSPRDLTVAAVGIGYGDAQATVLAGECGIAAGLAELAFVLQGFGVRAVLEKKDGEEIEPGDVLLRAEGPRTRLLSLERVGLNLMQRMSGIATATHALQARACSAGSAARIVATRKTPWGLLDKRAVHLGGGGTHRLGLGDAIVIKNNHLELVGGSEEKAAPVAIARAWTFRREAAFIEVEVRGEAAALAAARAFCRAQEQSVEEYPCLLMLDNMTPEETAPVIAALRREKLWDAVLVESSGGISEANAEAYAACGVDAISIGALTHSPRALDLCQRIS